MRHKTGENGMLQVRVQGGNSFQFLHGMVKSYLFQIVQEGPCRSQCKVVIAPECSTLQVCSSCLGRAMADCQAPSGVVKTCL